ncbi:MAG: hypothetical protein QOI78_830 [Actinomycetota bacterium]|nr:hypothetical protein [Actinomycetota bacterium]
MHCPAELSDSAEPGALADGWSDRVDLRRLPEAPGVTALLLRPDGSVAWAADGTPDTTARREALTTWFGEPRWARSVPASEQNALIGHPHPEPSSGDPAGRCGSGGR